MEKGKKRGRKSNRREKQSADNREAFTSEGSKLTCKLSAASTERMAPAQ